MIVEIESFEEVYSSAMAVARASAKPYPFPLAKKLSLGEKRNLNGWFESECFSVALHLVNGDQESDGLLPCLLADGHICVWNRGNGWPHGPGMLWLNGPASWVLNGSELSLPEYLEQVDLPLHEKVMLKLRWG